MTDEQEPIQAHEATTSRVPVLEAEPVEAPRPDDSAARARRLALEWGLLILGAIALAFVIQLVFLKAFFIPSESMVPTLNTGDRILVNRLSYKLHDIHRGDIVVFEAPPEAQTSDVKDFVKRVVGLPGETVEARDDGHVYVNGHKLSEPYLPRGTRTDNMPPTKVPRGEIFVMGDNRPASRDSRYFGAIKESTVIGRAFVRIWPLTHLGFL